MLMRSVSACPFCASIETSIVELGRREWAVVCNACLASGPVANIPALAIEKWCKGQMQAIQEASPPALPALTSRV